MFGEETLIVSQLAAAAKVFTYMVRTGDEPRHIAEREGLLQVSDDTQLV